MNLIKNLIWLLWFFILAIPISILLYKFSIYLWYSDFEMWWISIIWLFTLPITTLVIMSKIRKG